ASGLAVRVAVVPAPHDPDSYVKEFGGEKFRELVRPAAVFFDYYLSRLCATNDITSDKGRLAVLKSMAEAVHKTGNGVLMDTYAQKTALRLGVMPESVRKEFKKNPLPQRATPITDEDEAFENAEPVEIPRPSAHEFHLLKLLLLNEEL